MMIGSVIEVASEEEAPEALEMKGEKADLGLAEDSTAGLKATDPNLDQEPKATVQKAAKKEKAVTAQREENIALAAETMAMRQKIKSRPK
jgi:hypothetical protein